MFLDCSKMSRLYLDYQDIGIIRMDTGKRKQNKKKITLYDNTINENHFAVRDHQEALEH